MIIYSRFNPNRKKQYQLTTAIEKRGNKLFVTKTASSKNSITHLNQIAKNNEKLIKTHFLPKCAPLIEKLNDRLVFQYIKGSSLESLLIKSFLSDDKIRFEKLLNYFTLWLNNNKTLPQFLSSEFIKQFGNFKSTKKYVCVKLGVVDLNFDNIIFNKDIPYIIDYEWIYDFPIPIKFILFRSLIHLYSSLWQYNINQFIPLSNLYSKYEITTQEKNDFIKFEYAFQKKVINKNTLPKFSEFKKAYIDLESKTYTRTEITINHHYIKQFEIAQKHSFHLQHDINFLNKEIANIQQTNKQLKKHSQHLQNDIDFLNKEIAITKLTNIKLNTKIKKLKKTNQSLAKQLNRITSTKAYKLWKKYQIFKKNLHKQLNPL